MLKKTLLSAAIASTFALSGCLDDTPKTNENAGAVTNPDLSTAVYPIFSPVQGALPIPNDLIFQQTDAATGVEADGTFDVTDSSPPVTTALNELSGASTTAPIDIAFNGVIDESSVVGPEDDLATQNVFLVELTYASGEPVQALSISEPPIPANAVVAGGGLGSPFGTTQPSYSVEVIELDGVSTIRINPEEPLDPKTRYVVAIVDSILDINGEQITASPGAGGYAALARTDTVLNGALTALQPVQALATRLWEPTALAYINNVDVGFGGLRGTDPTVPVVDSSTSVAGTNNLALSYSFTTSDDASVLTYMADPAQWVADSIEGLVALGAAEATVTANSAATFGDVATAVATAKATWDPTTFNAALGGVPVGDFATAGATVVAGLEGGALGVPMGEYFPDPKARTVTLNTDAADILDINQVSALMSNLSITPGTVSVVQGTIEVPYYLDSPGATGAGLVTGSWEADDTLATVLSGLLPTPLPQRDPNISTAVSSVFPFAKEKSTQTIPMLAIFPTDSSGPAMQTVIFQHGITTDRSAALAFGAALVNGVKGFGGNVAVIAIDQPLHGIGGFSAADQAGLAEQLAAAGGLLASADGTNDGTDADAADQATIDAIVAEQFSAGVVQGVDAATNSGAGGATSCIDLATNGLAASIATILGTGCDADPIVDAALGQDASAALGAALVLESTVQNGGSTIPGLGVATADERHFGFTADASAQPTAMDFDGSAAANGSGTLFINLGNFLGSRDNLRQGTMDLLNLRASLDGLDLNGAAANGTLTASDTTTYFIGHSLGTVNGIPFVKTLEETTATSDNITAANFLTPGGMVTRLIESSQSFGPSIIGGLGAQGVFQDSSSYQAFLNVLQGATDSGDAINFVDGLSTPSLFSIVIGDTTIPNEVTTTTDIVPSLPGTSSIAPLAGSEPLVEVSGADANVVTGSGANALSQNVVRYTAGFHGTPVFPSTGTTAESAVFQEMVSQAASIVLSGGTGVTSDNTNMIIQ